MPEYIEREAVLAISHGGLIERDRVADMPAADVVPVVRCKNCQSFQADEISAPNTGTCWMCEMVRRFDDFCSYGERKD